MKYQIRDERFGLALYDAADARDALYQYFADRVKGQLRPLIETSESGGATVAFEGTKYEAVEVPA